MTLSRRSFGLGLAAVPLVLPGLPSVARAADTIRCAIGHKNEWDTMIVQQGLDEGFFQKAGVAVEPTYTEGGSDTIQIVAVGTADIAIGAGITSVIGAFGHGANVKILGPEMNGASDTYWYVRADSPIKTMADMNGKTMAYSRFGSTTYLAMKLLAAQAKVTPTFVASGDVSPTLTQVMSGQLDAGWASAPYNFDLLEAGKIRVLAHEDDAPQLRDRTIRVNVINSTYLAQHPAAVAAFMKAYAQTVDWMYANEGALRRYAKWNDFGMDIARETLKYYPKRSLGATSINGLQQSVDDAITFKSISGALTREQLRDLVAVLPGK
jgi:NitT/TauT family transport system substrate-binding protein